MPDASSRRDDKATWDAFAVENARFYVATTAWKTEREFDESGERDAALLFGGLEPLLTPTAVVLDLGCGIGRMDRFVAKRVGKLVGIDVSGEMVRRAKERLRDLTNVEFIEGDGESLKPFRRESFDVVFSYITFQHLSDEVFVGYVREARRVLRPGGHLVFQVVELPQAEHTDDARSGVHTRFHSEEFVTRTLESEDFTVSSVIRKTITTEDGSCDYVRFDALRP